MTNKRVVVAVKWIKEKKRCDFFNRNETRKAIFVPHTAITRSNPQNIKRRVGQGERVEFRITERENGLEPVNILGYVGRPVQNSPYDADRRPFWSHWFPRRGQLFPVINS